MLTVRKILRSCFAYAALIYLVASSSLIPVLYRSQAANREFLSSAPRTATLIEQMLLLLSQLIFATPVILALLNGMAWWTLRTGKKSGRVWAIAASLSLVLSSIMLWLTDLYLNSHFALRPPPLFQWIIGVPALIGMAGLVAFGPRNSTLVNADAPRIAGDGTHKYLDALALILQFAGIIWLMNIYSAWGNRRGLPFTHGLELWIQWFLVIGAVTILHESAHALVGVAVGMKLRAFIVGPFQFRVFEGRWRFDFRPTNLLAFSGAAGLASVNPDESRWNEVAMIAAGPLINLLTGSAAAALAYAASDAPWRALWEYFALFATVSLVAGFVNLLPLRPDGLYSDGARILQLFRGGPLSDYRRVSRIVQASSVSPIRPRDYDIAAIDRASLHFTSGEIGLLLRLWASEHYEDLGAFPQARAAFAQAEQIYNDSASDLQAGLHSCLVIGAATICVDPEATREWWRKMTTKKIEHHDVNYWLAKCAFHWSENDLAPARDAWDKGFRKLAELPDVGGANFDRDSYRRMKELLDNHETRATEREKIVKPDLLPAPAE